ncbi:MAG: AAA family ATPase [Muribaculaceae bacterium]|nr:AAA family ATPase [Muribaculaceae bacterium]
MDILVRRYRKLLSEVKTHIHRSLYYSIDWNQSLIGIKGQRGVGKTTIMLQRIKDTDPQGDKSFYTSLDNLWFAEHNLIDLAEELVGRGVSHLYLDEVHRLPGWERQIKNLYDSYPELQIVFTSSSLLVVDYSIADLSRRVAMYTLPGLSFREYLEFEGEKPWGIISLDEALYSHETIAASISSRTDILRYFREYLKKGYYPFYKSMGLADYYGRLDQMVSTVIDCDIPAVESRIEYETLIKAKRLVGIIAGSQPYQPNMSTLAGLMGTNRNQLLKLLDLLDRAGIIRQVFNLANSPKTLSKPQKILLDNSTLMCALGTPMIGAEREATFVSFLSVGHRVGYAKDGDFIVDNRYLFEVGGKGKNFSQIRNIPDSFVASDDIEFGLGNKIPLWIFGFLY